MSRYYEVSAATEHYVNAIQNAFPQTYDATPREINRVLNQNRDRNHCQKTPTNNILKFTKNKTY